MKKIKITLVILIITSVSFISLEILSRVFRTYNDTNPVYIIKHTRLPYTMLKDSKSKSIIGNEIIINSHGFRDYEYSKKKNKNTYRILVLGDSTTFGYGVKIEESYPKVLEDLLNKNFKNKKIEVLNFGVSGFNLIDYYNVFKEYGAEFLPDCIIIGLMQNDFTLTSEKYVIENGIGKRPGSFWVRYNIPSFVLKLLRNSGLYLTIGNALKNIDATKINNLPKVNPKIIKSQDLKVVKGISGYLAKFNKISNDLDIPIYYLYLPTKREVELNRYGHKELPAQLQKHSKDKENINFIDMLDNFKKNSTVDKKIYSDQDPVHPTAFGHKIYANSIYKKLLKQNTIR